MLTFCYALMMLFLLLLTGSENSSAQTACGRPQVAFPRITGGTKAKQGEWPWQISLRKNREHICGGSLISNQWVVTAASCFNGPLDLTQYKVNLGEYELPKLGISASISQIIVYPHYAGEAVGADIALVKLNEPVKFSRTILPICLPNSSGPDTFSPGMSCSTTGWASTIAKGPMARTLQKVDIEIIDIEECNKRFQNETSPHHVPQKYTLIYEDMICAVYPEGKKGTCQGDSGGPLACKLNDTWFLAGIVSFRFGCEKSLPPDVYTRTSSFMDWIQDTMAQNAASWGHTNCATVLLLPLLLVLSETLFDSP